MPVNDIDPYLIRIHPGVVSLIFWAICHRYSLLSVSHLPDEKLGNESYVIFYFTMIDFDWFGQGFVLQTILTVANTSISIFLDIRAALFKFRHRVN